MTVPAERVLIVAEGPNRHDLLGRWYDVELAADGSSGLAAARSRTPDLVLIALDESANLALLEALRANAATSTVPVLVAASKPGGDACIEALARGANDVVASLVSERELLARVSALLRTDRLRRSVSRVAMEWQTRYEAAVRACGQLLYDWDPETGAVGYAGELEGLVGYTEQEMAGGLDRWIALVHPEDRRAFLDELTRVKDFNVPFQLEYRIVAKGGHIVHCEDRGYFVRDSEGRPVRMIGFVIDVTPRKLAETARHESEERLRLASEAGGVGLFERDLRTNETHWSPVCATLLGATPTTQPSWDAWIARVHDDDRQSTEARVRAGIESGEGFHIEYRVVHDRGVRWLESTARIVHDEEQRPRLIRGILHDITERKRLEAERDALLAGERAARAEAEHASRQKDDFLAVMSHELRTPLNAILGWTHMLRRGTLPPPTVAKALDVIERNTRVQVQLIADLLDVSRITSGKLKLDVQRADLGPIVDAAIDVVRESATAKDLLIERTLQPDLIVNGDPTRLQQIVWNLLSNAIKFSIPGQRVWVTTASRGARARISVKDEGQGIHPDFIPHLFERFSQADNSAARHHGGLGLGLSIVRHLVELHGGLVWAESEGEGRGATLTIELPLASGERSDRAQQEHAASRARPVRELASVRVLVVDDDPDARELVSRLLIESGASVRSASSVKEALATMGKERPDAIVSDLGMPGEDGFQFIRRIRDQAGSPLPAIALTAFARPEDKARALALGFDAYIEKPFEPQTLVNTLVALTS